MEVEWGGEKGGGGWSVWKCPMLFILNPIKKFQTFKIICSDTLATHYSRWKDPKKINQVSNVMAKSSTSKKKKKFSYQWFSIRIFSGKFLVVFPTTVQWVHPIGLLQEALILISLRAVCISKKYVLQDLFQSSLL